MAVEVEIKTFSKTCTGYYVCTGYCTDTANHIVNMTALLNMYIIKLKRNHFKTLSEKGNRHFVLRIIRNCIFKN